MASRHQTELDLKEACLAAAREVIAEAGVEALSLRDVARKLGVSHQAPYRHFASRDHLLAEVVRRCFVDFAEYLSGASKQDPAACANDNMGERYMQFAAQNPLEYRLMFGTPWPEPAAHPELIACATHAFNLLRNSLRLKHGNGATARKNADLDALFIWSALHGMASIQHADVMKHLNLARGVSQAAQIHLMKRIAVAVDSRI